MKESPYFYIEDEADINTISELMNLGKKRKYMSQGNNYSFDTNSQSVNSIPRSLYETPGIFRGQAKDWPLLPASYRNLDYDYNSELSKVKIDYEYNRLNRHLLTFCEMASKQNNNFPKSPIEQMCIARHYGINTPLLDWTTNIFVAVYFALDLKDEDDDKKNLEPFIYHIKNERLLKSGIENEKELELVNNSAIVNVFPLDRRIERQFSIFSFHPHPMRKPEKIPLDKYKISASVSSYL